MHTPATENLAVPTNGYLPRSSGKESHQLRLKHAIKHAAHLLPAQGPITVFIHHNTLHAFEDLPFAEAVEKAAGVFGCQPYLTESRFREELARGRIRFAELDSVLREDLGPLADETILDLTTRLQLRRAMLQYPLRFGPTEELLWFVAETDALRRVREEVAAEVRGRLIAETRRWVMRDLRGRYESGQVGESAGSKFSPGLLKLVRRSRASHFEDSADEAWEALTLQVLWRVCCDGVTGVPVPKTPPLPDRHRDLLLLATGWDVDLQVHDLLIAFCAAFLDQGLAHWQLPCRDNGFIQSFRAVYGQPYGPPDPWLRNLAKELSRFQKDCLSALDSITESLETLGVEEAEWESFLASTLLALRGWAGMTNFLDERPDRAVHPIPPDSLTEFLAIRLLLDRLALQQAARDTLGYEGPLNQLRQELRRRVARPQPPSPEQRAFLVFQLAQVLGWTPKDLSRLDAGQWTILVEEIEAFSAIERRRVFHLAYERRFTTQTLDALTLHRPAPRVAKQPPSFQAMFCIDEREESMRRHVEELAPDAVTFGIAGFYFVPMYYRGAADAHFVPLCPVVIQPKNWVVEEVVDRVEHTHQRRARTRRALGIVSHQVHTGSRSFAVGALVSGLGGVLASIPLVARTLFPRLTARIRKAFGSMVTDVPSTHLHLERAEESPGSTNGQVGFSLEELTNSAERVLRDTGLTSGFARLVLTFGHGSASINNPHESAYDCGACGGSRGGPNGRAIAQTFNDPRIRERLKARGLEIPADTVFIGGMHNTCNDSLVFYDLDQIPLSHLQEFEKARELLERAAARNAHERCRRFLSAPLTMSFEEARLHVEGRAEDLAQARPEAGHATNAITMVGRRERTRGLYLDRRSFLNSYDPTQDSPDGAILTRILQAALPVCAGISLEYYFSYVDNTGFGCGTKLPHNITALLGVMDGAASDLRTGLPWQMVEIHEPVRSLFVLETTPAVILGIMERHPALAFWIRNEWVQLAVLDPHGPDIQVYRNGKFQPYQAEAKTLPRASSSVDWYRGWRDHLEFAVIGE